MKKYICVHGHFYQPPRENPWLESLQRQDSAYPYHDWNERITHECYAPNAHARMLDGEGRIVRIVNNYSKISFNFGPTLLSWLEEFSPAVYQAVIEADKKSVQNFGGHGSAMAQAYNHMIMPLASTRDKRTQILWGLYDFRMRFERQPEGMWLGETAVDLETLDMLAEEGISYTVLAPTQAARFRKTGGRNWTDASGGSIDPTMAYGCRLPSGRRINLFFYDGPISRAVAFEQLLDSGERLANRLVSGFSDSRKHPQLVHIATDGETYGHHHRYGEMGLAYALHTIEENNLATLTNYGQYLEMHPPTHEVEIHENSSWSCAHGVGRWSGDCGCHVGGLPGWNQKWRGPLRKALDFLRDELAGRFEEEGGRCLHNPWQAREKYIEVISGREPEVVDSFLEQHAISGDKAKCLRLLEMQRNAMLMYTSCGWFFDDLSGIETVQVLRYAGRAIQLCSELCPDNLEQRFLSILEKAQSNIPAEGNGRQIYEKHVKPAAVDLEEVGAHYAISSLFESYPEEVSIYCYDVNSELHSQLEAGKATLLTGKACICSRITTEALAFQYAILHLGDHNITCGVRPFEEQVVFEEMAEEVSDAFHRVDFTEVIRALDRHFSGHTYSLSSLFSDEQQQVLDQILESNLQDVRATYRQIYDDNVPLMRFLTKLEAPLPDILRTTTGFILNTDLKEALSEREPDLVRIGNLLNEAEAMKIRLDELSIGYVFMQALERRTRLLSQAPDRIEWLGMIRSLVKLGGTMELTASLWVVQNAFADLLKNIYPAMRKDCETGNEHAKRWMENFLALGEAIGFLVE